MLAETTDPSLLPAVISRWTHFAAIIIAVGGTVFIRLVMHPVSQAVLPADVQTDFRTALIRRWSRVLHTCIAFILLSGIYNSIVQFPRHRGQPLYHSLWGIKVLLALLLFFIAIAITGKSAAFEKMRQKRPTWMAVNIVLAGIIVLLSNILKNLPATS
jgi:putative copper export protein